MRLSLANKRFRLIVRWGIVSGIVLAGVAVWAVAARDRDVLVAIPGAAVEGVTTVLARNAPVDHSPIRFEDVTKETGIRFTHFPDVRASLLPEDMGSGVAAGDYDGDGLIDVFFVNFAGSILRPLPTDAASARCRLFRNLGNMRFDDVTTTSGLGLIAFAMGAAWGDYDDDGDLDLYVTAYGANTLYENLGNGTFTDVTDRARVRDPRFSAGASWGDYDRDGDIDLYVCNYVDFVFREDDLGAVDLQYDTEIPFTLNPSAYAPVPNSLFRNNGDGTFDDVAVAAGVADPRGRSLSATWTDFDNDGWPDLYVANDVSINGVFRNNRDGTFEDVGPSSLAADYRGAMGIAVADYDDDLDQDIFITHWIAQENALFRNMTLDTVVGPAEAGLLWFLDTADRVGFGQQSLDMIGWATGFIDFDNDARKDLWIVNGSTFERPEDHTRLRPQAPFVFRNRGDTGYDDVAAQACPTLAVPLVGRGGAHADWDRDGLVDLVVAAHGGAPIILKNTSSPSGHWFRVVLRQTGGNTFALGARVYVTTGVHTAMAEVGTGASYLSQDDTTLHFGLGDATLVDALRIVWPDGAEEIHERLASDRTVTYTHAAEYGGFRARRTDAHPSAP